MESKISLVELRKIAKEKGLKNISKLKKDELIQLLKETEGEGEEKGEENQQQEEVTKTQKTKKVKENKEEVEKNEELENEGQAEENDDKKV